MRLFRRSSSGFWGTAAAAALLVAMSVLAGQPGPLIMAAGSAANLLI